jgi:hypothetical protein
MATLWVRHWPFILALTGTPLGNGDILEYDPMRGKPGQIDCA